MPEPDQGSARLFSSSSLRYDRWYDRHPDLFQAELAALKRASSNLSGGLEVGVGTGRFAAALGLDWGIDPEREMLKLARQRGCRVIQAMGEDLPFATGIFNRVVMVTVLCFLSDPARAVKEALRVIRPGGQLLLGIIEPESGIGRAARARRDRESFYAEARFLSVNEILQLLPEAIRGQAKFFQSIFPEEAKDNRPPKVEIGRGRGAFAVVSVPWQRGGEKLADPVG